MCVIKTNGLALHRKRESSIGESLEGEYIGRGETPTTFRDFTFPFRRKAFDEGIKST